MLTELNHQQSTLNSEFLFIHQNQGFSPLDASDFSKSLIINSFIYDAGRLNKNGISHLNR